MTPCSSRDLPATPREPLALVGIGCRFPGGADTPEAFWQLLHAGKDAIREAPADRWRVASYHEPAYPRKGKLASSRGGFLASIEHFDPLFFGISPREAVALDPQQRILLELAWEALEDAGTVPERLAGSRTGVFLGLSGYDHGIIQHQPQIRPPVNPFLMLGTTLSIAANRISHAFDLRGPSIVVDTACSSSLAALHLACRSLWHQECDQALVGGISLLLLPSISISFSNAGMLSPDGLCRSFDAEANGYVRSEGGGLVLLKPLRQAQADRDRIYALVLGTAVNQDGRTPGISVPNGSAQEALVRAACSDARVAPGAVQYIEAHGTGTPVGDPIEANALGAVLGEGRRPGERCWLGSVKANIGHLEAAAGIAGLIKTALALHHRVIPPQAHFSRPNPQIDLDRLGLAIPLAPVGWPANGPSPRLAGINSFGFGGTNAHAILGSWESAIQVETPAPENRPRCVLLPLSARAPGALADLTGSWRDWLAANPDLSLQDLAYTAGVRRSHHPYRLAVVANSTTDAGQHLDVSPPKPCNNRDPNIVLVFSGMGPQWWGMGRELLDQEPSFLTAVTECDHLLRRHVDWSLLKELRADPPNSRVEEPAIGQPALFALQVGLARLWQSWGVRPAAVVGHSVGEIAAAHVAGALSLEDAIAIVHHRSRLQQQTRGRGRMLAASISEGEANRLIADSHAVAIAAVNSPGSVTLSGDAGLLEALAHELQGRGIFCRFLAVDVPYHSHVMDPLRDALLESLQGLNPGTATFPLYSTVTGQRGSGIELGAAYWWQNIRAPVRFAGAIMALVESGQETFLEVGPHPVLATSIQECATACHRPVTVLPSLRRGQEERAGLLQTMGQLYVRGLSVAWERINPTGRVVALPAYPWQRERYWNEADGPRQARQGHVRPLGPDLLGKEEHPLLGRPVLAASAGVSGTRTWHVELDLEVEHAWLADHRFQGTILYPAAGYLAAALAALRRDDLRPIVLEGVEFSRPLLLSVERPRSLELVVDDVGTLRFFSKEPEGTWLPLASGKQARTSQPTPPLVAVEEIRRRCPDEMGEEEWYGRLRELGWHYGPCLRGVRTVRRGDGEALGLVALPRPLAYGEPRPGLHAALIDVALQCCIVTPGRIRGPAFPRRIEQVVLYCVDGETTAHTSLYCHVQQITKGESNSYHISLLTQSGGLLFEMRGVQFAPLGQPAPAQGTQDQLLYESRWQLQPRTGRPLGGVPSVARLQAEMRPDVIGVRHAEPAECRELRARLNALCADYVRRALLQLNGRAEPGSRWSLDDLIQTLRIVPDQRSFFRDLIEMLAEEGDLAHAEIKGPLQNPDAVWQELLARYPAALAELTLLGRCGANLADILRGQIRAADLLFPGGSPSGMLDQLEGSGPSGHRLQSVARATVAAWLRLVPAERPSRVLQLGGSGLAASLLPLLSRRPITYVLADPSPGALEQARQSLQAFPQVEYRVVGPDGESARNDFDLLLVYPLLGVNSILPHLPGWLAPGGVLTWLQRPRDDRTARLVYGGLSGASLPAFDSLGLTDTTWVDDAVLLARAPGRERPDGGQPLSSLSVSLASAPRIATPRQGGSWLLCEDDTALAEGLGERLARSGYRTIRVRPGKPYLRLPGDRFQVDPDRPEDFARLLTESAGGPLVGIAHFWSVEAHPLGCVSVLHLVQACVRAGLRPRLYLITRGAQPVRPGEVPDVHQAPVWGLGRSIRSEHPELRCTLIDLDDQVDELAEELVGNDVEDELALRGADRFVHRLVRVTPEEVRNPGRRDEGEPAAYRFESEKPGLIETVRPRAMTRREPGAGEVEIEIRAAALNFKDVAKALDLLGEESLRDTWSGRRLGLECAGVVVRRGEGFTGLEVGDAVIAQAAGCLASHVTVDARFTVPLPAHLSFEEAVTLPVAFGTAAHALEELARLERGERILIHAACGGVGLAAIQLARRAGAEVFATAGSAEKRAFLGLLGVRHVMDSRKLDFQHEVLERTGGRGVDVVLNSLTGASLMSSLAVLAPGGRFLELGKRDIEQNARLPLQAFQNNLSFFAIDLDRLWSARPEAIRDSLARTMQRLKEGTIHPLPYRAFPFAEAQDAFRWLARARHIGKVVLTRPRSLPDERVIGPDRGGLFRPDATYLITGGLGGFGLATARWLVENGARCVALVGRSGLETDEGREVVAEMERTGARIRIARADVTQEEQVRGVLQHVRETLPPLRGIFHAAMVQDEGLLGQLDRGRFDSVLAPKIAGALNLHRLSLPDALDHFVLFSSIASLFGGVGLSSYAAANAGLDALAHHRRARGLPGLAVNWTAVEDVGFVAGRPEIRAAFARRGFVPLDSGVLLEALGILLRQGAVQTAVMQLDWSQVQTRALPALSPTYSALRAPHEGEPSLPQERARGEGLRGKLAELVARVLMLAPERIESDQPLTALGLESMMAVDLSHRVRAELGLEIAILKLLGGATLNQLLDDLQEQLDITHTTRWQPVSE